MLKQFSARLKTSAVLSSNFRPNHTLVDEKKHLFQILLYINNFIISMLMPPASEARVRTVDIPKRWGSHKQQISVDNMQKWSSMYWEKNPCTFPEYVVGIFLSAWTDPKKKEKNTLCHFFHTV